VQIFMTSGADLHASHLVTLPQLLVSAITLLLLPADCHHHLLPRCLHADIIVPAVSHTFCQVGSTPGVTKGIQEIHLDKQIKLLDSPGIVFTSEEGAAAAALRNAIKVVSLLLLLLLLDV
jgi:hypothetical protein